MNSTDALPAKSARSTCTACGLNSPAPIVVRIGGTDEKPAGRCSNRNACDRRIRRTANAEKARNSQ